MSFGVLYLKRLMLSFMDLTKLWMEALVLKLLWISLGAFQKFSILLTKAKKIQKSLMKCLQLMNRGDSYLAH